jgi:CheY-like chemotaxis protein
MIKPGGPLEVTTGPVLVVDDEPAVRDLFARALRDAGYETIKAADGVEALQLIEHHSVALILLDATMPRLDGAGVIRAVRAREATRTLPVILVTAKGDLGGWCLSRSSDAVGDCVIAR